MGSASFETTVYGVDDLDTAYANAVSEARDEYGYDPYNGTISTTSGAVASPLNTGEPIREDRIDWEVISERLDHLSKWQHCEALRVAEVSPGRIEYLGVVTVEVKVPSDTEHSDLQDKVRAEVYKTLARWRRSAHKVDFVTDFRGTTATKTLDKNSDYVVDGHLKITPLSEPKRTTKATTGKTVTKFFIVPAGSDRLPPWSEGHPTQAAARAALPDTTVPNGRNRGPVQSWEIISVGRREDGAALVTHDVDSRGSKKNTTYRVEARVSRIVSPPTPTGNLGWLFYGWAAT